MRIVILGANGYIGSNLVTSLLEKDLDVSIKLIDVTPPVIDRSKDKRVSFGQGDINKINQLEKHFEDVDLVFHFLGNSLVRRDIHLFDEDYRNDVSGTIKILSAMIKKKVKKIVFLSSGGTVYGDSKILPIKESFILNPISTYGLIKTAIENILLLYHREQLIEPLILRVSSLYGPNYNKIGRQGVIPTFIDNFKKRKEITIFGTGHEIRDYLYIDDLIELLGSLLNKIFISGIFNIGSGTGTSTNQIIGILKEISGDKIKINRINKFDSDVTDIILDIEKARSILFWSPATEIQQGITKCWNAL